MVDNKSKSKAAMLLELESIKGLLQDEDDIPILQEVLDHSASAAQHPEHSHQESSQTETAAKKIRTEQQRDFFYTPPTVEPSGRQSLAKASGENPFLPEHIRSRLHGNNPPPLFEIETAKKIATTSKPKTLLGNTHFDASVSSQQYQYPSTSPEPAKPLEPHRSHDHSYEPTKSQHALIEDIVDNMLPILEKELRERLEFMTREMLEDLLDKK